MNLQLSLKRQWFEMTKAGIKTEDYRAITPYWIKRLTWIYDPMEMGVFDEFCEDLKNPTKHHESIDQLLKYFGAELAFFTGNIMTLGYPKKGDPERTLNYTHEGIEIRIGNPEWGAEPNKLYFVIKHGNLKQTP
jgi:hypothetical protein